MNLLSLAYDRKCLPPAMGGDKQIKEPIATAVFLFRPKNRYQIPPSTQKRQTLELEF